MTKPARVTDHCDQIAPRPVFLLFIGLYPVLSDHPDAAAPSGY